MRQMRYEKITRAGYTYGDRFAIDNETGELKKMVNIPVIEGSVIFDPQTWKTRQDFANQQRERDQRRASSKPLGHFLLVSGRGFEDIPPATLTRLILLTTYADYEQRLMVGRKRPMRRADAQSVLKLNDTAFKQFLKQVFPRFLVEKAGVLYLTDKSSFLRGKLPKGDHEQRWKLYIQAIRHLYEVTPIRQHKHLGHAFQLLRHINLEFNVLCHDIYETCIENIRPMTLHEFCEVIGYDWSHVARLLSIYRQLTFKVGDHMERFISIVYDGLDRKNALIYVNPRIVYSGSNYKRVEILGSFCKV